MWLRAASTASRGRAALSMSNVDGPDAPTRRPEPSTWGVGALLAVCDHLELVARLVRGQAAAQGGGEGGELGELLAALSRSRAALGEPPPGVGRVAAPGRRGHGGEGVAVAQLDAERRLRSQLRRAQLRGAARRRGRGADRWRRRGCLRGKASHAVARGAEGEEV
ncbi:unnamed protein product [Prorocentrum cordatum]|uniref:Uncharacterized protein n=1 Tax=Prorocentrum cordatum TaxID=2364126 RepID=A0ABN9SWP1_9DINO|nr:unnamed protein product [Polarella glacialis]